MNSIGTLEPILCDICAEFAEDWTEYAGERMCMACFAIADRTSDDITLNGTWHEGFIWRCCD